MNKNMGTADRTIRILIAIAIGVLYFNGSISGVLAVILGVVAIVFLATSLAGRCPGYVPLGISTRKQSHSPGSA